MWLERALSSIQHCFLVQVPRYFTTNSELTAWHKAICFNNSMPLRKSFSYSICLGPIQIYSKCINYKSMKKVISLPSIYSSY